MWSIFIEFIKEIILKVLHLLHWNHVLDLASNFDWIDKILIKGRFKYSDSVKAEIRGQLLSGTTTQQKIVAQIAEDIKKLQKRLPGYHPNLTIVQVGDRQDSEVYIKQKIKMATKIGIKTDHIHLPKNISEAKLMGTLETLNDDPDVHGIIVEMPLDSSENIDPLTITDSVAPEKDVDGLNSINEGRTAVGDEHSFIPCTPTGVMELIKRAGIKTAGAEAIVVGRSKIVGTPIAELLKWANATVTICHSKTQNLPEKCRRADILVVAVGKPELVKGHWIKPGAVVVDCGINVVKGEQIYRDIDSTRKLGYRILGDVHFESAKKVASFITPVPGGVGPMTVAMIMKNTFRSAEKAVNNILEAKWNLRTLSLELKKPVPSDIDIVYASSPININNLAQEIGVYHGELIPYGHKKAKISLKILKRLRERKNAKLVVVVGMTPTTLGEGKTTSALGLVQALAAHKKLNAIATLRQPSQGPVFGIKGGAAGGGYSQIIPMEDFNLHLTGDFHAISLATNLVAAQIDTRIFHETTQDDTKLFNHLVPEIKGTRKFCAHQLQRLKNLGINKTDPNALTPEEKVRFARLDIDPKTVTFKRVVDINDRCLRKITIGQSPTEKNLTRETGFQITVASEIMAILALASDAEDLRKRIASIVIGFDKKGNPVTADDLGVTGAVMVLLKDALDPTLMQTLEGTPVLVHAGPFANIAHGCSSILADKLGAKLAGESGYVITEGGFGSDIGLEKLCNIKCRASGAVPRCIVLVATIRAIKMHGGGPAVVPGEPLSDEYTKENLELLEKGIPNLAKHISNGIKYGVPVVVCINAFHTDTDAEVQLVQRLAKQHGAFDAVVSRHWSEGGAGALKFADAVIAACKQPNQFKFLYNLEMPIPEKIQIIAREMYGAGSVTFSPEVTEKMKMYEEKGFGKLAICMAKTATSFTGDPRIKGAPTGFELKINDVSLAAGAGFIIPVVGKMTTMPGLPTRPNIFDIDYDLETGMIKGLF